VSLCLDGGRAPWRKAFLRYALGETGSKLSGQDFLRTLGDAHELARGLRAHVLEQQTPFEALGDWEDRGATGLSGAANAAENAFCVLRRGSERLAARMGALPKGRGMAGFVAGWFEPQDCALIRIEAPEVVVDVLRLGRTESSQSFPLPGDAARERRIELVREGASCVLRVDDARFGPIELPSGRMGFFVSGARVAFQEPTWR
jgi:hypothetical protein